MSRRSRRAQREQPPRRAPDTPRTRREPETPAPEPRRPSMSLAAQLGLLVAVFAGTTLIAELAGAANLGVALGVGQIAFAIVLVWLIAWR
jgi:hypothetical protein